MSRFPGQKRQGWEGGKNPNACFHYSYRRAMMGTGGKCHYPGGKWPLPTAHRPFLHLEEWSCPLAASPWHLVPATMPEWERAWVSWYSFTKHMELVISHQTALPWRPRTEVFAKASWEQLSRLCWNKYVWWHRCLNPYCGLRYAKHVQTSLIESLQQSWSVSEGYSQRP